MQYVALTMTVILSALAVLVISVEAHENSHILVCNVYGYEAIRTSWVTVHCNNDDQTLFLYRLSGGVFAAFALLTPLAFWRRFKDHIIYSGFLIVCLGYAVGEFEKGIVEAVDFAYYASGAGGWYYTGSMWATIIILGVIFRPKPSHPLPL